MNTPKTHPQKPSNTADETPNPQRFSGAWETKRLGEIAHIKTGSKNNEDKDENGRYPLFVRSATVERINSYCYDGEAILVPGEGGIGSIFHYINGRFDCHQRVYMINRFTDDMCGRLVYYNMMLQFGSHAMKNTVKATVDSLRLPTFKNFSLSIPKDTDEQRAIAEALSDVDGLLNALEALIAKKQAIKQAVMQQLLTGKTRLPGFSGAWETKRLGEIAYIKTGSKNNEDKNENGQYPFFVRSAVVERINSYCFDGEAILVPGEGGIESIFHYINGRFDCHQRVYMINRFAKGVYGKLVYYIMVLQFGSHAMQNTVKATVDSLRLPTFKNFCFFIPKDIAEQYAIASVLSDMDAEIAALEQRRDKTRAIKQGMMQQLLTGRVRLSESRICTDLSDDAD